jgi:ribosomal protein S10
MAAALATKAGPAQAAATVQIRLYGYERTLDFAAHKVLLGADLFPGVRRATRQMVMLPTREEKWTVLKSPHVHKSAQENFLRHTHKRLVVVHAESPAVAHRWVEYTGRVMPPGINAKATISVLHRDSGALYRSPVIDGASYAPSDSNSPDSKAMRAEADAWHAQSALRFALDGLTRLRDAAELSAGIKALTDHVDTLAEQPLENFVAGPRSELSLGEVARRLAAGASIDELAGVGESQSQGSNSEEKEEEGEQASAQDADQQQQQPQQQQRQHSDSDSDSAERWTEADQRALEEIFGKKLPVESESQSQSESESESILNAVLALGGPASEVKSRDLGTLRWLSRSFAGPSATKNGRGLRDAVREAEFHNKELVLRLLNAYAEREGIARF